MGPVRSVRNQYLGVNAHLHSALQNEGGWGNFHTRHIVHLADWLNRQVRSLGYIAVVEDSLQIRRADESVRRPTPVHTLQSQHPDEWLPLSAFVDTSPLSELSEKPYQAVAIYASAGQNRKPVAWMEVLSTSSKSPSADAEAYCLKRQGYLENGIVFVEFDYLHETPPALRCMADYSYFPGNDAHPYRIVVLDPYPDIQHGHASLNMFSVDEPIPNVNLPLNGSDLLSCNFAQVYQTTYEAAFLGDLVDYATLPANFDRYSPADQARIANRMLAVLAAAQTGADLEAGPLPAATLSLDMALKRLAALDVA